MRTLNLGILAHVDAGKTTLTERLLFTAGAIDRVGSVDAGTTQTDSLDLERERGITIRSAVASFLVGDLAVNLVDTPGHPDFIAEVERVLGVLDGAVLVVSAVEGVQPQTPLLFRALQRLHVPTLIFVNKIDRAGADDDPRHRDADAPAVAGDGADGRRPRRGHARRVVRAVRRRRRDHRAALTEVLAEHDEAILRSFVGDEASLTPARLRTALAAQTRQGWVHPGVLRVGGDGSGDRRAARRRRRAPRGRTSATRTREVSGRVFKIERTPAGRARRLRPPVRRHAPAAAARARRRRRGGEADVDQGVRAGWSAEAGHARGGRDGGDPRPRLGAGRRRDRRAAAGPGGDGAVPAAGARGRRVPGQARRGGQPPRGARPARRAGPAHRRPPGRRTGTRSRSRSTARSRRRSSGRRSSATTASPRTSARRPSCASSARRGRGRPRRSSAPRPTRTSRAAARR